MNNSSPLHALSIEYRDPAELELNPRNSRTHTKKQISQIASSILEFGFTNPILVDERYGIIAGHGRLAAARQLAMTKVPVIVLSHLSASQKRALVIADNKLALNAAWDATILREELIALSTMELTFDVSITGFDTPEIDVIASDIELGNDPVDIVEAVDRSRPAVTRPSGLWLLGAHRLLCGNSLETESYETLLGTDKAHQVVTDPPYNVAVDGHVSGLGKLKHREFAMASGEMAPVEFTDFLSKALRLAASNVVDGAIIMSFMDWRHLEEIQAAGRAAGLQLKNLCVWDKINGGMGSLYRSQHELVLIFKNGTAAHTNNVELGRHGRYRTNIWRYAGASMFRRGRQSDLETHPTVKPIAMIMDAIKDCSARRDIVLDPFGGSGTTLLAAERVSRRARLIEIDPYYVDATVRRWQKLTGRDAVDANTGKTFAAVEAQMVLDGEAPIGPANLFSKPGHGETRP